MEMRLTFIVPCLNAEATIEDCLRSIFEQSLPKSEYEVIVVDNGSIDRTIEIAKTFPIRLIHEPRRGASAARNAGIAMALGRYFAFVDSDVTLENRWAEVLLKEMGSFFDGAQGKIIPAPLSSPRFLTGSKRWLDRYRYQMTNAGTGGTFLNLKWFGLIVPLLNTAACIYRASLVRQVGGFNVRLLRCEDNDLAEKVLAVGGALLGCENVGARVAYDGGLVSYLKRSFWIGWWRNRLNQAWKRTESTQSLPLQRWKVHGFDYAFWRLNGLLGRLGYFCSAYWSRLVNKEPPSSILAVTIAEQAQKLQKIFEINNTRLVLARSIRVIAFSNKMFFTDVRKGVESVLIQDEYVHEFLSCFESKDMGDDRKSSQCGVIEFLLSKGVLENLNS